MSPSRAKNLATQIKNELVEAGFRDYFRDNHTKDRSFASDDFDDSDDPSDLSDPNIDLEKSLNKLNYDSSPDPESYLPNYICSRPYDD